MLIVEDVAADLRFYDRSFVTGVRAIGFYAGAPVTTGDNTFIGAPCVVDAKPRKFS